MEHLSASQMNLCERAWEIYLDLIVSSRSPSEFEETPESLEAKARVAFNAVRAFDQVEAEQF